MSEVLTNWRVLWVLVIFLWVVGGLGWIDAYESKENKEFNWAGKTVVILLSPILAGFALISAFIADMREIFEEVRDKNGSG